MKDLRSLLLALCEAEERRLKQEVLQLLARVKRECRPEFAERVETHLRREGLLDRNQASN